MVPWVTVQKVTHLTLVKPRVSKSSENTPSPPQFGCQTDRQELPPSPILTAPPGKHKQNVSPRNPFSPQQHWYQSRTIHLSGPPPKNPLLLSFSRGPVSQSQTFTVHTCLPQTGFIKYQCICCLGAVPKTSCTIHTHHSLFLFVF